MRAITFPLAVALALAQAFAQDPSPAPTFGFPPHAFGIGGVMHGAVPWEDPDGFNHRMLSRIAAVGGSTSVMGLHWAVIEPEPGVYDWSRYDEELALIEAHGIDPVGLIVSSPAWASRTGEAGNFPPGEHAVAGFIAFCSAAASRYAGRISRYSFWNEPDIIYGWGVTPNPTDYARWQARYYQGIKAGNPNALAGTGGFLGRSLGHLEAIYRDYGGGVLDAVAIHPYPDLSGQQGQPYFDNDMITSYRSVMVAHGDAHKPIWCTEFGWNQNEHSTFETYAWYLERSYDYMLSHDYVTLSNLHIVADWDRQPDAAHMGICDVNLHPRPPYWTFYRIARGETPAPHPTPPAGREDLLYNGDFSAGTDGWTAWHEDEFVGRAQVSIDPDGGYDGPALHLYGSRTHDSGVYQRVSGLDPSGRYQVIGFARADAFDQPLRFTVVGIDTTGQTAHGSASTIDYTFMAPAAGVWRQYTSPVFSPQGGTVTVFVRNACWFDYDGAGGAWFDAIALMDVGVPTPTPTAPTPTPPAGTNLVRNPGAETGDFHYWQRAGDKWPTIDPSTHLPEPLNHGGAHRFGISIGWAVRSGVQYQEIAVQPGRLYEAGMHAVRMDGTDDALRLLWVDGPWGGAESLLYEVPVTGEDWYSCAGRVLRPAGPVLTLVLRYDHTAPSNIFSAHVDDVWLVPRDDPPAPAVLMAH